MHHYFNDDITIETVNNLVDKLQAVDKEEKIELYFTTNGGCPNSIEFLVGYFNTIKDRLTITLTYYICSAGTAILEDFDGKIKIADLDYVMWHICDRKEYNHRTNQSYNTKIIKQQDKNTNLIFAEKIKNKGYLTDKQLKDFINGRDVYAYQEQIKTWKL